jgi:hypothetical protein
VVICSLGNAFENVAPPVLEVSAAVRLAEPGAATVVARYPGVDAHSGGACSSVPNASAPNIAPL